MFQSKCFAILGGTILFATGCGPVTGSDPLDPADCVTVENAVVEDTLLEGCILAPEGLTVTDDILLTIAPGARVVFGQDTQLIAYGGGRLNAEGTVSDPIVLTGEEEIPSYWIGVQYNGTNSTDNVLDHVVIEYAGQESTSFSNSKPAALDLNSWDGPVRVSIDNTTIRQSDAFGIRIDDDVVIPSFNGNTITENKTVALVTPSATGQLAGDSAFGGNTENTVEITGGNVVGNVTWPALDGADYLVRTRVEISGEDADNSLTVAPGVTLAFDENTGLIAFRGGVLTARGTEALPITFTGKEKTAGYWRGLHYNSTNSTENVLEHAVIEYGGGQEWSDYSGSERANLLLNNWSGAVRLQINDVVIRGSGSDGLHIAAPRPNSIVVDGCSNVTFEDSADSDVAPMTASCPQ